MRQLGTLPLQERWGIEVSVDSVVKRPLGAFWGGVGWVWGVGDHG